MTTDLIAHETATRLRLRCGDADAGGRRLHEAIDAVAGVLRVRRGLGSASLIVEYDGRKATRTALLRAARRAVSEPSRVAAPAAQAPVTDSPASPPVSPRLSAHAGMDLGLIAGAVALLPLPWRPPAAVGLALARGIQHWRAGDGPTAVLLESASSIATALTGNAGTSAVSMMLGAVGRRASAELLAACDARLWAIALDSSPADDGSAAERRLPVNPEPGDVLHLGKGDVIPCDGVLVSGRIGLEPAMPGDRAEGTVAAEGDRVGSGARVAEGAAQMLVERARGNSRAARLRDHIRHAILAREQPGPMSPDLQRLASLPLTAAGVVYAVTGDARRSAPMLQADPQEGLALSLPVARDASIYAMAREGVLMTGLDAIERLASATTIVLEDIGILSEPVWRLTRVRAQGRAASGDRAAKWLAIAARLPERLAGEAGYPDALVARWLNHGSVLRAGTRVLHLGGAAVLRRDWGISIAPSHAAFTRHLGLVANGRLIAELTLESRVRAGAARCIAALRAEGGPQLAVLTEDPLPETPPELADLGVSVVGGADREGQRAWLHAANERGERIALVHTGLRDLLPPGGLSICPIDADAGAHGVLLGDPLECLLAGRRIAVTLRSRIRRQLAAAVVANGALLVASATRVAPPMVTASLHHVVAFAMLAASMRTARSGGRPAGTSISTST